MGQGIRSDLLSGITGERGGKGGTHWGGALRLVSMVLAVEGNAALMDLDKS